MTVLTNLENRLEDKLDSLRAGFISWKAFVLLILPILFAGVAWLLAQHQAGTHANAATTEQLAALEEARAEHHATQAESIEKLSERLEKFNETVQENSIALERLSTTIEFAVREQRPQEE